MNVNLLNKEFEEKLREEDIDQAADRLDLNFEGIFLREVGRSENPYLHYHWLVMPNPKQGLKEGIVIHAVPPTAKFRESPWEEWFVLDGEKHHHVLFTEDRDSCDQEIFIDRSDRGHPEETRGTRWFYFNDSNLTPKLFQAG